MGYTAFGFSDLMKGIVLDRLENRGVKVLEPSNGTEIYKAVVDGREIGYVYQGRDKRGMTSDVLLVVDDEESQRIDGTQIGHFAYCKCSDNRLPSTKEADKILSELSDAYESSTTASRS